MNVERIKEQKMRSVLRFSIPAIIAMVLASFITIADGFFIGNYVGPEGIAAVNLGLPIIYLYLAVGLMISVGGVAIAGIAYGEGDRDKCKATFNQTLWTLVLLAGLVSLIVGVFLARVAEMFNVNSQVAMYFRDYYGIMIFQLPLLIVNAALGMFIRSEGNPQYFMKVNILNVVLNIFLNYLFVKWIGLGIVGIAIASLLATFIALVCMLYYFVKKSKVYQFSKFSFSKTILKNTLLNGSSEFIGEVSLCISMFAYNVVIMKYIGVEGVTAFAIVGYIAYVFSMIVIGFGQGVSPLLSFTYGAKDYGLTRELRRLTNRLVAVVGGVVCLVVLGTATGYGKVFVSNEVVEQMIGSGARIFALSFLFSGVNTITSFYFTSIGRAFESAVISAARGLVILLICIFTLPQLLGMTGVWLVAPITEILTFGITLFFIYQENRKGLLERVIL